MLCLLHSWGWCPRQIFPQDKSNTAVDLAGGKRSVSSSWISPSKTLGFHPCENFFSIHPHVSTPRKAGTGTLSAPGPHRKDLVDKWEGCSRAWFCPPLIYLPMGDRGLPGTFELLEVLLVDGDTMGGLGRAEPSGVLMWTCNCQLLMELWQWAGACYNVKMSLVWIGRCSMVLFIYFTYALIGIYCVSYIHTHMY